MTTTPFTVRARRWKRLWELHIDGVGVTQASRLNRAEETAVSYIAMVLDLQPEDIRVDIVPEVGQGIDEQVRTARHAVLVAQEAQEAAARQSRQVVQLLGREGLTQAEVAAVLAVSPQRVSQLLKDQPKASNITTSPSLDSYPGTVTLTPAEVNLLLSASDSWERREQRKLCDDHSLSLHEREKKLLDLRFQVVTRGLPPAGTRPDRFTREDVLQWAEAQVDRISATPHLADEDRKELIALLRERVDELLAEVFTAEGGTGDFQRKAG